MHQARLLCELKENFLSASGCFHFQCLSMKISAENDKEILKVKLEKAMKALLSEQNGNQQKEQSEYPGVQYKPIKIGAMIQKGNTL